MKSIILVLLTMFCLAGCGGSVSAPSQAQKTAVIRTGTVFVGDSIVGRWDLNTYFPGKNYINGGWFGQRTDQMLVVFPAILDGSRVCHGFDNVPGDPAFPFSCQSITPPSQVVILLGWNDLFQGFNPTQAARNIDQMAKQARAAGVKVVLVQIYRFDSAHPDSWMKPWDSCSGLFPFRDSEPILNANIGATLMPPVPIVNLESLFVCQSDYTIDGVHPNANGYQQMAQAFAGVAL